MTKTTMAGSVLLGLIAVAAVVAVGKKAPEHPSLFAQQHIAPTSTDDPSGRHDLPVRYVNTTYHFSFSLPETIYFSSTSGCHSSAPVKAEQVGQTIRIGGYIDGCPNELDAHAFIGWTIHAESGIAGPAGINQAVRRVLGTGCGAQEWQEDSNAGELHFWVTSSDPAAGMEEIENACPAALERTEIIYSRSRGTVLWWSMGQQPAFPARIGWYDGDVAASFRWVDTGP